jgi:hypothetical protein
MTQGINARKYFLLKDPHLSEPDNYKTFIDLQQKEAQLHWTRNNYFLVTSSVLLVALSQLHFPITVVLGVVGLVINIIWVLIQYRSSKYIEYYKKQAQTYKSSDTPDIYPPNLGGIEMRRLVYFLPFSLIVIWFFVTVFYHP